jgi:hypothetical protein
LLNAHDVQAIADRYRCRRHPPRPARAVDPRCRAVPPQHGHRATSVAGYLGSFLNDRCRGTAIQLRLRFQPAHDRVIVAASVSLIDHLFARDVVAAVARDQITGLAACRRWIRSPSSSGRAGSVVICATSPIPAATPLATLEARRALPSTAVPDVWPDWGVPRHYLPPGAGAPAGFDRRGDSNTGILASSRRHALCG